MLDKLVLSTAQRTTALTSYRAYRIAMWYHRVGGVMVTTLALDS